MVGKSEKQKMIDNELYQAADLELTADRKHARELLNKYNRIEDHEMPQRLNILNDLFGSIGENVEIIPPFQCDYGYNIHIQSNVYMNCGCVVLDCNTVHIGKNVFIGPSVQVYSAYHPTDPNVRLTGKELAAPIIIEDNIWIGGGAIICPGVTIGKNSTIGAGSIVVKDIPGNVIAAGNPCRVIKEL